MAPADPCLLAGHCQGLAESSRTQVPSAQASTAAPLGLHHQPAGCCLHLHGPLPGQVALGAEVGGGLRGIGCSFIVRAGHWERNSGWSELCAPPAQAWPPPEASHLALSARPSLGATDTPGGEAMGHMVDGVPSTPQAVSMFPGLYLTASPNKLSILGDAGPCDWQRAATAVSSSLPH